MTLHTPQRMWHGFAPNALLALALGLIALAFSVGLASGLYGRTAYTFLTTDRNAAPAPVAAPQPQAQRYLLGGHGELAAGASNAEAARR
jgi:hypothetical protein